jgi:hypothetical protein
LPDQPTPGLSLPAGWARNVKSVVLHVISLAHYAIISAHGWAASPPHQPPAAEAAVGAEDDLDVRPGLAEAFDQQLEDGPTVFGPIAVGRSQVGDPDSSRDHR